RDGTFRLDNDGHLVTQDGVAVSGDSGPIQLDPRESFTVGSDGTVTGSTSGEVAKIPLFRLSDPKPLGGSRWGGTASAADGATLVQGATEGSNADPMRGMVELMESS